MLLCGVMTLRQELEDVCLKAQFCHSDIAVINDKMKENDHEMINKIINDDNRESTSDGWDVFRFQVSEEHRINRTFDTVNDFLKYWLHEYNKRQESSRLAPIYMKPKVYRKPQSTAKCQGLEGFRREVKARYQKLSYTDKAIYRAIAKEYFRKKK